MKGPATTADCIPRRFLLDTEMWQNVCNRHNMRVRVEMLPTVDNIFEPIPQNVDDDRLLRMRCDSQSLHFYGDISRFLAQRVTGFETLSLLDVGSRTGAGTALLRLLHHPLAFTRLKFDPVVGLDLNPDVLRIIGKEFKDISAVCDDIFNLEENSYDVVVCSHTIEHLPEIAPFVAQLEKIARRYIVLACPVNERLPASDGHIQIITTETFAELGYTDVEVYESFHFHNGLCGLAFKKL